MKSPIITKKYSKDGKLLTGFTIIELIVVIAIIGVLAAIVVTNVSQYTTKAKIAATEEELHQIVTAFEIYRSKYGALPPSVPPDNWQDNCSACDDPCSEVWNDVVSALAADKLSIASTDAWGNYFCYDNNDQGCCGSCSVVYSMGPDGVNDSQNPSGDSNACVSVFSNDDMGQHLPYGGCSDPPFDMCNF